jgi:hypothetical protein
MVSPYDNERRNMSRVRQNEEGRDERKLQWKKEKQILKGGGDLLLLSASARTRSNSGNGAQPSCR